MTGPPPHLASAKLDPPAPGVAESIRRAVETAGPDALQLAAKAVLAECGYQRRNAYRHGLPDSAAYQAVVGAAARIEDALIDSLSLASHLTPDSSVAGSVVAGRK